MYFEQVNKYIKTFGNSNVHIILYDDFKSKQLAIVREVYNFLDVDGAFVPTLTRVNERSTYKYASFHTLIHSHYPRLRKVIPLKWRRKIRTLAKRINTRKTENNNGSDQPYRSYLGGIFDGDIEKLSKLISRPEILDMWR